MKVNYEIYVEGSLYEKTTSKSRAYATRDRLESEGWNVRLIEMRETVLGLMGVER